MAFWVSASGVVKQSFYRGENSIEKLLSVLREWSTWCYSEKQRFRWLKITKTERKKLLSVDSVDCCICGEKAEMSDRVIHHCHLTGEIFGVAHSNCNLRARTTNFLPVFFHNFSRYDSHHILKNLKLKPGEKLSAISKNDETFTSFSIAIPVGSYKDKRNRIVPLFHSLRFLDSLQFMPQSLDALGKTLQLDDFALLRQQFSNISDAMFLTLTKKGHFPYNYLDSFAKFNMPLPPFGDDWKNTLTGSIDITLEQFNEALYIYDAFSCKNLGDYHDIYLQTDVFILADIFEKFRKVCLKVYNLDPAHFYSAPNLSWDAMLISTKVTLGLLDDIDKLLFFERGIRGGVNGIGEIRQFKANNPLLPEHDPNKATTFGAFFDVTSLYARTMQKMMPIGDYEWNTSITLQEVLATPADASVGFFVEVDLLYPKHLHDKHNGLPLAPEKRQILPAWLSVYARSFRIKPNKNEKLIETLFDRKNYVCHYENLKFYVKHGLLVGKLHRVCQFKQSKWLGIYIEKNTVMRKQANNDFEKAFFKLMSNACFGKTMENLRKRSNLKFVSNIHQAESFVERAVFKSFHVINENLVSVSLKSTSVVWDKPTPVGASILDLSKLSLYKFHYEEMIPRYTAPRLKLAYKDTDSLLYCIETENLYEDMARFKDLLDPSDYPQEHFLYDPSNKKVPSTMTDELQGKILREVVCLRSKLYSIDFEGGKKQSAKGVTKSVKKTLHHDLFKQCLFSKEKITKTMAQLRSFNHQIVVNSVEKAALTAFDDKRYLLDDGIRSLAYGHYSIPACTQGKYLIKTFSLAFTFTWSKHENFRLLW